MKKLKTLWYVFFTFFCITGIANALTITTSTTLYTAGPDPSDSSTANSGSISSHVSHSDSANGDAYGSGEASAFADADGTLSLSTSYEAAGYDFMVFQAMASYSENYVNTSGSDLHYSFSFGINEFLSILGNRGATVNPQTRVEVMMNNSVVWDSATYLFYDRGDIDWSWNTTNPDIEHTITDNSTYDSIGELSSLDVQLSGSYGGILDLGVFAPGDSFDLQYNIFSAPYGMDAGQALSSASIWGDVTTEQMATAPEPASFFLLVSGLIGLVEWRKIFPGRQS